MKNFSDAAMAAIVAGEAIVTGAVAILSDPAIRVWGGYWPITLDGEIYQPIGDRGIAQQTGGAIGGAAQGITLTLSGIDPAVLELLDADEIDGAPVVVYRLIYASDGKTLLDYHVFDRGRVDQLMTAEVIGGEAKISVMVEGAARGLGRRGGRMRSDADQRLISDTDGYFKNTGYAPEKMLYWGGKRPTQAGSAFGGSSGGDAGVGLGGGGRFNYDTALP
jgi:hypothetical protein